MAAGVGRPSSVLLDQGLDFATRNIKPERRGDWSLSWTNHGIETALGWKLSTTRDLTAAAYAGKRWSGDLEYGGRLRWSFGG